jgi:predicted esterase
MRVPSRPRDSFVRRFTVALALAVAASAARAQEEGKVERVEPGPKAPRGDVLEWTSAQGKPYWYRLPKKPGKATNLVLMLHGTGLKWGWAFWNYPIATGEFRGDDIVIAPEGMTDGGGGTFNFVQGKNDGEHIAGLIQLFRERFEIQNVYLYGHSQGAFFTYWFAGEYPELVNGIVAHAGNVLDVKFPKYAKENVAIGILHGRADAVVPVECAFRTEEVYRSEGYKKLKLYVVEGLTEQSGHWPLPVQVSEMLAWLDQASASTPAAAVDAALLEVAKDVPDFAALADLVERARGKLAKHKGDDKAALDEKVEALAGLLASTEVRVWASMKSDVEAQLAKPAYGAWAARLRLAHRAFRGSPTWKATAGAAAKTSETHEKKVRDALEDLGRGKKSAFGSGVEALEASYLAPSYVDLVSRMRQLAEGGGSQADAEDKQAFRALVEARKAAEEAGAKSFEDAARSAAAEFREKRAAWFEAGK